MFINYIKETEVANSWKVSRASYMLLSAVTASFRRRLDRRSGAGCGIPNLPPLPPSHLIQHHRAGDGDIERVAGSVHRDGDGCVAL